MPDKKTSLATYLDKISMTTMRWKVGVHQPKPFVGTAPLMNTATLHKKEETDV